MLYLLIEEMKLQTFNNVQRHKDKDTQIKVMHDEMSSLKRNNNFELVELLNGRKALKNKWVLTFKRGENKLVKHTRK